jgi:hypothetical protein
MITFEDVRYYVGRLADTNEVENRHVGRQVEAVIECPLHDTTCIIRANANGRAPTWFGVAGEHISPITAALILFLAGDRARFVDVYNEPLPDYADIKKRLAKDEKAGGALRPNRD